MYVLTRLASALSLLMCAVLSLPGYANNIDEQRFAKLQAAYVYNIVKFVQWPTENNNTAFNICLLADQKTPLFTYFLKGLQQQKVSGRAVQVHLINGAEAEDAAHSTIVSNCQLLYFTREPQSAGWPIIAAFSDQHVLRIAAPGAAPNRYSLIDLVLEDSRISLYLNAQALPDFTLPLSPSLLNITKRR